MNISWCEPIIHDVRRPVVLRGLKDVWPDEKNHPPFYPMITCCPHLCSSVCVVVSTHIFRILETHHFNFFFFILEIVLLWHNRYNVNTAQCLPYIFSSQLSTLALLVYHHSCPSRWISKIQYNWLYNQQSSRWLYCHSVVCKLTLPFTMVSLIAMSFCIILCIILDKILWFPDQK